MQSKTKSVQDQVVKDLSESYEFDLARIVFQRNDFTSRIVNYLNPQDHLSYVVPQWICWRILEYHRYYKHNPPIRDLLQILNTDVETNQVTNKDFYKIKDFIENDLKSPVPGELFAIDLFKKWLTRKIQIEHYLKLREPLERADLKETKKLYMKASTIDFEVDIDMSSFVESTEAAIDSRQNVEVDVVNIGLPVCRHMRGGGIHKKDITLILAPSNVGKTSTMVHCVGTSCLLGYKVFMITLETSKEEARLRIDSRLSGMTAEEIHANGNELKNRLNPLKEKYGDYLYIAHFTPLTLTPSIIRSCLNRLIGEYGFKPDLLAIDSCDDIIPDTGITGNDNRDFNHVFTGLMGVGKDYNVAILGSAQSNREAFDSEEINLKNMGKAIEKVHRARCIVGLTQTPQQVRQPRPEVSIHLLKNTWGKKGFIYPAYADFHIQKLSYSNENRDLRLSKCGDGSGTSKIIDMSQFKEFRRDDR